VREDIPSVGICRLPNAKGWWASQIEENIGSEPLFGNAPLSFHAPLKKAIKQQLSCIKR